MDVWRYSDWYGSRGGNEIRYSQRHIWRWRDWIVNSLNADKSYARMIGEMLAADEVAAEDDTAWPATGYLIRNYYSLNPNEWMRFNVEYTAKAFLGLTFNCAHCHDHKYDPIENKEYFRFRAFFEPIEVRQDRWPGEPDPGKYPKYSYGKAYKPITSGMVRIVDEKLDAKTFIYTGGEARNVIIANTAEAFVAVSGSFGTLSEMAFALKRGKPVFRCGCTIGFVIHPSGERRWGSVRLFSWRVSGPS